MALKDWKKHIVEPNRILWTKGEFVGGEGYPDWIHIDKIDNKFDDNKFEVGAHRKINNETQNGHFKFFKSKSEALSLARKYMRSH